jgi:hypothetical protein
MSKTAERRERQREARREQWKKLERMIDAYAAGLDRLDDDNLVSIETISSEIVARYRPMLTDASGVNHDGPLFDLISRAMKAEQKRHV